ncbi:FUSC family protein [Trinickia violacea]|uniref:FUSC family protein n=1 Tax=Trinickia violacea TaxID=2571746 RepID=A0A4P8IIY4_9BURK|nr:FUSC family protein [Trinickia violacea]QCP48698.1 FUSC family protein [Trinickia violacea]
MASTEPDRLVFASKRFARIWRSVTSPYYRFKHARMLHSIRVGLAMLASILLTTGVDFPHGIWASVTVLVVIGGLQHSGNIRKKAAERALGTMLGALIGLLVLIQLRFIGSLPLTYVLMSVVAAICGYFAIGRPAYIALLTAITMCIVAGHGDNTIDTGLWRTLNVLIGIAVALAFSFALPLHATYSWRYLLARNLRECAHLLGRIARGEPFEPGAQIATFAALGERLVKGRALMPSVAKEIGVSTQRIEAIQRVHRSLLSALELMATGSLAHANAEQRAEFARRCGVDAREVRSGLLSMSRALRFGSYVRLLAPVCAWEPGQAPSVAPADLRADLQGPYWLSQRFAEQVEQMRVLLLELEPHWNIERQSQVPREV